MKCVLIVSCLPDILFIHADRAFKKHINKVAQDAGFVGRGQDNDDIDMTAVSQLFSPMITSLTYMNDLGNPYSSILCEDGTIFVFAQFDDLVFAAVNGDGDESEDFLKRKLSLIHKLAVMHYGVALDLLKPELLSAQKRAWKTLGSLIDTWGFLACQQQSFLVEAVERIHVNKGLSEMSIGLLDNALSMTRNKGDPGAVHAMLLVNTKLLALYSSRQASELKSADILMITLLAHNIFPHSRQKIPLTPNRTPPPLAHEVIRKGTASFSHHIMTDPSPQGPLSRQGQRTPRSKPVNIRPKPQTDRAYDTGNQSSIEEEFYSPRSSPTSVEGREFGFQEPARTSGPAKERFFTPRAPTPEYLRSLVRDEVDEEKQDSMEDEDEVVTSDQGPGATDPPHEYYRQPVFLSSDKCPYIPHVLHFVRLATGTLLVLISETKQAPVAHAVYQVSKLLTRLNSSEERTQQTALQAQSTMERLEISIRRIFEAMRTTVGAAVENQVRGLRHRWELVKRADLVGYLAAPPGVEMSAQLESSLLEIVRCLKALFSVLFCTGRGESSLSEQQLATISQIKDMLQSRLKDYEDYLLVKGERNVTMTAYLEDFPGLVHFIYVDRSSNLVTAPSINTALSKIRDTRDPCYVIKQKIWDMWAYCHTFLLHGHTFVAVRNGDFLFTYSLWFQDSSGNSVSLPNTMPTFPPSVHPGILSNSFYRDMTQLIFPTAPPYAVRCCELLCVHVGLVPVQSAFRHMRRLAIALFETSLGAHYPISLIQ